MLHWLIRPLLFAAVHRRYRSLADLVPPKHPVAPGFRRVNHG